MNDSASCIVVDDEPLAIRLLQAHLEQVPRLKLRANFQNPLKALDFLRAHPTDLVFLDIQMPTLTGMEIARILRPAPAIIFTTAYRDYAVESYELDVVDYLIKPITFPRFYQAIDKFWQTRNPVKDSSGIGNSKLTRNSAEVPDYRYFNVNKKYVRVQLEEVTHIESLKDYIRIYTLNQNIVTKEKISELAANLPSYFIRVHRSFIVNSNRITAFNAHDIEIGQLEIPIGVSYKITVLARLTNTDTP